MKCGPTDDGKDMPCKTLENKKGEIVGFACGGKWGMGVTDYGQFEDNPDDEYRFIYGFGGSGDPHNFTPDYDCNTKAEIAAWEKAKSECKCGR